MFLRRIRDLLSSTGETSEFCSTYASIVQNPAESDKGNNFVVAAAVVVHRGGWGRGGKGESTSDDIK